MLQFGNERIVQQQQKPIEQPQQVQQPPMTSAEAFKKQGYIVISDVITEEEGKRLTEHMFKLHADGKTTKDPQCPLSDSIYGDIEFDTLMEKLAKPLGETVGYELLPTYTYARIYRKGDELKIHKDRPSCEISATITLGFSDYPIWPINMGDARNIILDVGDATIYKGCDIDHWREPFKGEWQCQVFFHFVDANGPYKDQYKDGRKELGKQKTEDNMRDEFKQEAQQQQQQGPLPEFIQQLQGHHMHQKMMFGEIYHGYSMMPSHDYDLPGYMAIEPDKETKDITLSSEDCKMLIDEYVDKQYGMDAGVGSNMAGGAEVKKEVRSCKIYAVPKNEKTINVYNKIISAVAMANKFYYDFELSGFAGEIQLLEYKHDPNKEIADHYDWHMDTGPGESATRKLSVIVQLSDSDDYKGCELIINNIGNHVTGSRVKGSLLMFPGLFLHTITPITEGTRYSLVVWFHGNKRFR